MREMLPNPMYTGQRILNRTEWIKDHGTRKESECPRDCTDPRTVSKEAHEVSTPQDNGRSGSAGLRSAPCMGRCKKSGQRLADFREFGWSPGAAAERREHFVGIARELPVPVFDETVLGEAPPNALNQARQRAR